MVKKIVLLCLMLAFVNGAWAESERSSLALEGAHLHNLRGNADGSLIFLGVEFSPKSIFYSKDFGATWQYAAGGDFDAGTIRSLEIFDNWVFAVLDRKLRRAALPATGEVSGWSPAWTTVTHSNGITEVYKLNSQYLFVSEGAGNKGYIHNISSTTVDTSTSVEAPAGGRFRKIVGGSAHIIAQIEQAASGDRGQGNSALYRIAFDPATGQVSGAWESIIDRFPGVTVSQAELWGVHVNAADHTIFAVVRNYAANADQAFTSSDDGSSFTAAPQINFGFNHTCFNGDTWLFDSYLSLDGGASFSEVQIGTSMESQRMDRSGCYIVPSDAGKAMASTTIGVAFSTNVAAGGNWQISHSGLHGVVVNRISQASNNKNRAVMATYSGVAYSNNFTSAQPSWLYPICPNGNCNVLDYVVIDPNDPTRIYAGGKPNVSRGVVAEDGQSVTWSAWGSSPFMSGNYGTFDIFNFDGLKDRLYVTWWKNEGGLDGGIYYYPLSYSGVGAQTPTAIADPDVSGKPVASLYAISPTVMFANRGGTRSSEEAAMLAILQSRDGGENWTVMETGALPSQPYIAAWAYDAKRDTLYAGISSMGTPPGWTGPAVEGLYLLKGAAAGTGSWQKATGRFFGGDGLPASPFNLNDVAADSEGGKVFIVADHRIWFTEDEGATFHLMFTGPKDETTGDLEVDADPTVAPGFMGVMARRARLAQGANSGLYAFDINQIAAPAQPTPVPTTGPTPVVSPTASATPTPVGPPGICSLSVSQTCKRPVKKRTVCEMRVTMKQADKKAAAKARFRLQRAAAKAGEWEFSGGVQTTDKKGLKVLKVKIAAAAFFRAQGVSHECTSRAVQVKTKK